jgi:hypothetical protein
MNSIPEPPPFPVLLSSDSKKELFIKKKQQINSEITAKKNHLNELLFIEMQNNRIFNSKRNNTFANIKQKTQKKSLNNTNNSATISNLISNHDQKLVRSITSLNFRENIKLYHAYSAEFLSEESELQRAFKVDKINKLKILFNPNNFIFF